MASVICGLTKMVAKSFPVRTWKVEMRHRRKKNPHNFLVICGTENSRGTIFNWRLGGEIEILTGIN